MRLGINNVLVQIQQLEVVAEKQIQILQGLAQEERFHHVFWSHVGSIADIAYGRVAACHFGVLFETLEYPPAPRLVSRVAGQLVHVPQTLDELRPQQVVSIICLHIYVI